MSTSPNATKASGPRDIQATPTRKRSALNELRADEHGGAGLSLVFVIISVIITMTIVSALYMATTTATHARSVNQLNAASRTAVVTMEAELNVKTYDQILTEMTTAGDGYRPSAAIATDQETITYTRIERNGSAILVTAQITTPVNNEPARKVIAEYTLQTTSTSTEWHANRIFNKGLES